MLEIKLFFTSTYNLFKDSALEFVKNQDPVKAAALSFNTLTSIIPIFAILFGIAGMLGMEKYLENYIREVFDGQNEVIKYIIQFSQSLLKNTKSSLIASLGFITLLYTSFSILGNIESSLNDILKIRSSRDWLYKIRDYLALIIVCPVLFFAASSINIFLVAQVHALESSFLFELLGPFIVFLFRLVPFFLSILLFIIVYVFIPAKWVSLSSRIIPGILIGIIFPLWQWIYIVFQGQVTSYGAIYGAFAALPLFFLWLEVTWMIVLFGAEIAAYLERKAKA